jgi:hypothetical protein
MLGTERSAGAGEGDIDGVGNNRGCLYLLRVTTRLDRGFERIEPLADFPARLGRSALEHFADPRQEALLATDPTNAQLLHRLDGIGRGCILIELRQNSAEEAVERAGRIVF